jgi:hypothetical protein
MPSTPGSASASQTGDHSDPGDAKIFSTPILARTRSIDCAPVNPLVWIMFGTSFLSRLNVRLRFPFKSHSEERSDEESIPPIAAMRKTHICHLERNGQIFHFSDDQERFLAFGSK